jgi:transposase
MVISPYRERCWNRKGIRPTAKINFTREKFHAIGLLGRRSLRYAFCKKLNQKNFIKCLQKFLSRGGRIVIVLDNARWRNGKTVQRFAKRRKRTLKLVFLPPYSSELNPMELVVQGSKKVLSNKLYFNKATMKTDLRKAYKKRLFFSNKMFKYLCP